MGFSRRFFNNATASLELPEGVRPEPNFQGFQMSGNLTMECDGHIYTFHSQTGKWDDLDTRRILDLPEEKATDEKQE